MDAIDVSNAFIATPAKTILIGENPLSYAIRYTIIPATLPPINETTDLNSFNSGKNTIIIIVTKLAPDDIPVIPGSASGFFITACKSVPATPKLAPINTAHNTLGSLTSLIIPILPLLSFFINPVINSLKLISILPVFIE